jgi:histidine ammonia-lyase
MTKLIENVEKLSEVIADVANASTPVIGVGVGFGAVAVTAWDLGDWIMIALKWRVLLI